MKKPDHKEEIVAFLKEVGTWMPGGDIERHFLLKYGFDNHKGATTTRRLAELANKLKRIESDDFLAPNGKMCKMYLYNEELDRKFWDDRRTKQREKINAKIRATLPFSSYSTQ